MCDLLFLYYAQTRPQDFLAVCFVDPALVLEPGRLKDYTASSAASSIQPYVCLSLPANLVQASAGNSTMSPMLPEQAHCWASGLDPRGFSFFSFSAQGSQAGGSILLGHTSAPYSASACPCDLCWSVAGPSLSLMPLCNPLLCRSLAGAIFALATETTRSPTGSLAKKGRCSNIR
jgi:hypothetical protein